MSAHRGLADVEAGLEPFAVKAGGVPEQVGEAHRRITSRISSLLLGRPGQPDRHRQWVREPLRCPHRRRFDRTKVSRTGGDGRQDNGNSRHAVCGR